MSISGLTIMKGATGISVTGGTSNTFSDDGLDVKSGIHVTNVTQTNFLERDHATFKNRPFRQNSDGSYTKGLRTFNYTMPITLNSGIISYQVFRGEAEMHPEMTAAQNLEFRLAICQLVMAGHLDGFWKYGTI